MQPIPIATNSSSLHRLTGSGWCSAPVEAGEGYGESIIRRVLEIEGAMYLTLFEGPGKEE